MNDSFHQSDLPNNLKIQFHHQLKASIDSMYSQSIAESFSLSSSKTSSNESIDIQKILKKSEEIRSMVTSRLTTFAFMSRLSYEPEGYELGASQLEKLRYSLDETLNACIESEDKTNEVFVKAILEKICELERKYSGLENKLLETQAEIRFTEEEEEVLKGQMNEVEGNVNRFIIETIEEKKASCNCALM